MQGSPGSILDVGARKRLPNRGPRQTESGTLLLPALLLLLVIPPAKLPAQDVEEVVRKIDELYRSSASFSEVEMVIVTPHWRRTLRMKTWTEGKQKTFVRILSPPKEQGIATLRLGAEMWNYLPRANKVIKIPPSMMMSSWMGSDFTNDDLVKEFTLLDDYRYEFVKPQDAQPDMLYVEFIPKEGLPIVWGKIIAAIKKESCIPVWDRYYDEKSRLMRVIDFKDVSKLGGRLIPTVMEVIPQDKKAQKTVLRYLHAEFDVKLPDGLFTLRNLQSNR
jgi:outer membrane lipoprotein-sorting protein